MIKARSSILELAFAQNDPILYMEEHNMRRKPADRMFAFFLAMVLCFSFMSSLIPAQAAAASYTLASGVKAASDDMEEQITGGEGPGNMDTHSSDIEIGVQSPGEADEEAQYIGIRFADLAIPAGAAVTSAYIQFTVDEEKNGNPFDIRIVAEDVDNAETYNGGSTSDTSVPYDISNRYNNYSTAADVNWALAGDGSTDWLTEGVASELQRTPDIATLVQAVVDRPGWASGNAISFLMYGSGCRTAISYENDPTQAAVLHVTFEYDGGVLDQAARRGLKSSRRRPMQTTTGRLRARRRRWNTGCPRIPMRPIRPAPIRPPRALFPAIMMSVTPKRKVTTPAPR
jgi:hypothetical protein